MGKLDGPERESSELGSTGRDPVLAVFVLAWDDAWSQPTPRVPHHHDVPRRLTRPIGPPSSVPQGDNSALHWAAMRGHVEVVKTLLAAGADRHLANAQGKVPVDLCQACWSNAWKFTRAVLTA